MKKIILFLVMLILGGCSTVTPEQLAAADYGSYPDNYENIVKQYYANTLIDPNSVLYRAITIPKKEYYTLLGDSYIGYAVCVSINAKNSLGGYTGSKDRALIIRNGSVIREAELNPYHLGRTCR